MLLVNSRVDSGIIRGGFQSRASWSYSPEEGKERFSLKRPGWLHFAGLSTTGIVYPYPLVQMPSECA
jgi:hypothetical protein